jgi:hypothetical protein
MGKKVEDRLGCCSCCEIKIKVNIATVEPNKTKNNFDICHVSRKGCWVTGGVGWERNLGLIPKEEVTMVVVAAVVLDSVQNQAMSV